MFGAVSDVACRALLEQDHVGLALDCLKTFQVCFVNCCPQMTQMDTDLRDNLSNLFSIASDCFPVDDHVTAETATPQNKSFYLL